MTKEQIAYINNELQQIYTRGIDSVHMANALLALEKAYTEAVEKEQAQKDSKTEF